MKKIFWTGLIIGIAMAVVNMLLNPVLSAVFPVLKNAYMADVFRPWDDPIMMLFFLYPIILGFGLAWIWDKVKQLFTGSVLKKGINFGTIYFLVLVLPTFLINFSSFNLPFVMILSWGIMGAVNGFVAGFILAKLNK